MADGSRAIDYVLMRRYGWSPAQVQAILPEVRRWLILMTAA